MIAMIITYVGLRDIYIRANVIQLIPNTPFQTAINTICNIHICSVTLIVITSTKFSLKLL
jgi:hypothetical protein